MFAKSHSIVPMLSAWLIATSCTERPPDDDVYQAESVDDHASATNDVSSVQPGVQADDVPGVKDSESTAPNNEAIRLNENNFVARSAYCPLGGHRIATGLDIDQNGSLDAAEFDAKYEICDGTYAQRPVIRVAVAPASSCPKAGVAVIAQWHFALPEVGEYSATENRTICPSVGGKSVLVASTAELPSDHCATGGFRVSSGFDDDRNGTLDPTEVVTTRYLCHLDDRLRVLVEINEDSEGVCFHGGLRLKSRIDRRPGPLLPASEVDNEFFYCRAEPIQKVIAPLVTYQNKIRNIITTHCSRCHLGTARPDLTTFSSVASNVWEIIRSFDIVASTPAMAHFPLFYRDRALKGAFVAWLNQDVLINENVLIFPIVNTNVVVTHVPNADTQQPWNTASNPIYLRLGQTWRIYNYHPTAPHTLITGGKPCPSGGNRRYSPWGDTLDTIPGVAMGIPADRGYIECDVTSLMDSATAPDAVHDAAASSRIYVRVIP